MNIAKILEENYNLEIHYIEKEQIFVEELPKAEYYLFASRHRSESGETCLTVHTTGNFSSDTTHGGKPRELAYCNPFMLRNAIKILKNKNKTEMPAIMEATHHGPTSFKIPVIFVEVGSKEEDWKDIGYCQIIAETIFELIKSKSDGKESYIYFGGPHYAEDATELMIKGYAIGHICPKYATKYVDEDIVKQMIKKTPKCKTAIVDWKLKSEEKNNIVDILNKLKIEWVKRQNLKD